MEQKAKILLVDDDPDILEAMSAVLTTHGYTVITARDGQEGLAKLRSEKPDLMILDLMMPRMDGFAVCEELLDPRWAKVQQHSHHHTDIGQGRRRPPPLRAGHRLTAKGQRLHRKTDRSRHFADESGDLPEEKRVTGRKGKDYTANRRGGGLYLRLFAARGSENECSKPLWLSSGSLPAMTAEIEETAQLSARIGMSAISQGCYESIGNSVAVAKMRAVQKKYRHRAAARILSRPGICLSKACPAL